MSPQYYDLALSSYLNLFTTQHIAMFSDWLAEIGELYLDIYLPHGGGSSTGYFLQSLQDLKTLISRQVHPEISITIFRTRQFPLRGVANDDLFEQALRHIPDGEWYRIVSLDKFPSESHVLGNGNSHQELKMEFSEIVGSYVGIGQSPFDISDSHKWMYLHSADVFYLSVTRNRNSYQNYIANPDKYKWVEDLWRG